MPGTFETSCIARLLETSTVATSTFLTSQSQDKACWDSAKDQLQVRTTSGCHQQTSPFLSVDLFGLHDLHVLPRSRVSCECGTFNSNTSKPWTYHILPFETTINHNMYHMTVYYGLPRFTSISPSETFRPKSCQVAFQGFAKDFGDGIHPWIRFLIHHGGQILPVFLQLRELVRGALIKYRDGAPRESMQWPALLQQIPQETIQSGDWEETFWKYSTMGWGFDQKLPSKTLTNNWGLCYNSWGFS